MKLAIPKERRAHERRVAVTPDTVKKLIPLGLDVVVESGAGLGSAITDDDYRAAGAVVAAEETQTLGNADIVLKVQRPLTAAEGLDEYAMMKPGAMLIGMLAPYQNPDAIRDYARRKIDAFAMELVPRTCTLAPDPGTPLLVVTCTPAAFPWSAFEMAEAGAALSVTSSPLTDAIEPVSSRRLLTP